MDYGIVKNLDSFSLEPRSAGSGQITLLHRASLGSNHW